MTDNICPACNRKIPQSQGRPKGKKNKTLKLDPMRDEILRYMSIGISKVAISKLCAVHPQTLYNWMRERGINYKRGSDSA